MKLVSCVAGDRPRVGAVVGERVVDATERLGPSLGDMSAVIAAGAAERIRGLAESGETDHDLAAVRLLPVVPDPRKIVCVGLNYHDHITEANRALGGPTRVPTEWPMIFPRWAESLTAHGAPIERSKVSTQLDFEAELLVVIGRPTGQHLPVDRALAVTRR